MDDATYQDLLRQARAEVKEREARDEANFEKILDETPRGDKISLRDLQKLFELVERYPDLALQFKEATLYRSLYVDRKQIKKVFQRRIIKKVHSL